MPTKPRKQRRRPPTLDELVFHAGQLKRELVEYGLSDRFRSEWDLNGPDLTGLDESQATMMIDEFLLEHRLAQGGTIVERFARMRRSPSLSPADKAMVLGWRNVVTGILEVSGIGESILVRNLIDDLDYEIRPTGAPDAFADLTPGMFLIARIVPLGHGTDLWIPSGQPSGYPADAGQELARIALEWICSNPLSVARNPHLVSRALEVQENHRQQFIERFGSDVVILSPADAQRAVDDFFQGVRERITARSGEPDDAIPSFPGMQFPDDMMEAETIGVVYDARDALSFYWNLGLLDEFFADPDGQRAEDGAGLLRSYLEDDSINASVFRHMAERHPGTADLAFRVALERGDFTWERDGQGLLAQYKGEEEPAGTPRYGMAGERLSELLRA